MKTILAAILFLASITAHATVIYSFTGLCTVNCSGVAHVTIEPDIARLLYTDNKQTITPAGDRGLIGQPPGAMSFWWETPIDNAFQVFADGSWWIHFSINNNQALPLDQQFYVARGVNAAWAGFGTVPEPPTWALVLLALVALVWFVRKDIESIDFKYRDK